MDRRWVPTLLVLALLPGCATLQDTPPQAYIRELGQVCNSSTISMTRVDADGRYWIQGTANVISLTPYTDCMKEQERRQPYQAWLAARNKTSSQPQPVAASPQSPAPTDRTSAEPKGKTVPIPPGPASAPTPAKGPTVLAQPPGPTASAPPSVFRQPTRVAPTSTSVPIQLVNNVVLVQATLNTKHGVTLLLDTGAEVTILTPETARRIGLTPGNDAPRRRLTIVGGSEIEFAVVRLSAIQIGEARVDEIEVGVHDVAPQSPIVDGILGGDFLRQFTFTLNRDARQLRLEAEAPTGK